MTEQEARAIRWMKSVRDDAVVTLDHIAKNEPNVSPRLYAGRKEKAEVILNAFEELEQYRALGTVEELREAREKQVPKKPYIETEKAKGLREDYDCYECPNCDSFLGHVSDCKDEHYRYNYCPNCGQAIDWSDTE